MIYGEIPPGNKIPPHTHSCEEILYILEGEAEAVVGDERAPASSGGTVLVPAFARHSLQNVGSETLRQVGFYTSGVVIHTFDEPHMPMGQKVLLSPQLEVTRRGMLRHTLSRRCHALFSGFDLISTVFRYPTSCPSRTVDWHD